VAENKGRDLKLVVFRLGDEEYGADISHVREIVKAEEITDIPRAPGGVRGVIKLRGKVTTVIDLRRLLGMEGRNVDNNSRIVIVEADGNALGMMVDSVTEVKHIDSSQIQECSAGLAGNARQSYILGICKMKDRLLILVDLKYVLLGVTGGLHYAS
jgi:purine-binding chemotaxis protein CheW